MSTQLVTAGHRNDPAFDMALTAAMLEHVAGSDSRAIVRVFRPGPTVAFGRLDRLRPGFPSACRVAAGLGRVPLLRLAGGHAAVYDDRSIVLETISGQSGIGGLERRFQDCAELLQSGLGLAGIQTELGELAGEYCPGRFSVHLPKGPKIAGVAQRVTARASLTTAVLVVGGGDGLRGVVGAVYDALELPTDPNVAGALSDQHADVSVDAIAECIVNVVCERHDAEALAVSDGLLHRAEELRTTVGV